jgi:tRNA threonylcarbamoyladenosine biosynthesis protein TsaB
MILGIETSTALCGAALVQDGVMTAEEMVRSRAVHSERLMPMIQRLLEGAGMELGDLEAIAISAGPGSYTGLRIGMATAKGLCVSSSIPLVLVSTLESIAFGSGRDDGTVCSLMVARQSEVFAAVYDLSSGGRATLLEPQAIELQDLIQRLPKTVCLTGPGVETHGQAIGEVLGDGAIVASGLLNDPRAAAVALLGEALLKDGKTADPIDAEPMYLKVSQVDLPRRSSRRNFPTSEPV